MGTIDRVINSLKFPDEGNTNPRSLKDQLLQRAREIGPIENLRNKIREAKGTATPEIMVLFTETIRWEDKLGVEKLTRTKLAESKGATPREVAWKKAQLDWFSLSGLEMKNQIKVWAEQGDLEAKEITTNLELFAQNTILRDILWETIDKIERTSRKISGFLLLEQFLEGLVREKLAQKLINPRNIPEKGIVIEKGEETWMYLPQKGSQVSWLGWPFIKEAEARARERAEERQRAFNALRAKATPGLNPIRVSEGEEGYLFLFLGGNRGVLIGAKKRKSKMMARVVESVGIIISNLPSPWVEWRETEYRSNEWPTIEIPQALMTWTEKVRKSQNHTSVKEPAVAEVGNQAG